ncbi:hypothetical protein Salat_0587400 [Sesamum alatum]|uniref:Uncharacterized protein n=1 Tax=Sesamum alatum TaxID=300844 RepID=A0AAE1YQD3_9LAMI|nr:hypothetical protein Salat_0587400 [Sesamum alatum]
MDPLPFDPWLRASPPPALRSSGTPTAPARPEFVYPGRSPTITLNPNRRGANVFNYTPTPSSSSHRPNLYQNHPQVLQIPPAPTPTLLSFPSYPHTNMAPPYTYQPLHQP